MSLGPRYVPDYRLTLGGEPAPAELRASITSVSHESGLEGADRVELGLVNDKLRWLDYELLKVGKPLALELGYADGELEGLFVGEIVAQGASFPGGGSPTLTVSAQDHMQRLQRGTKHRWLGVPVPTVGNFRLGFTDLVVAGLISAENGLVPITDPVGAALSIVLGGLDAAAAADDEQRLVRKQENESDFDFLSRIARDNGWELMIDHTGPLAGYQLSFRSPLSHLDADVTLRYGESLMEFTPRLTEVGQIAAISANVPVSAIKTTFTVTVGWDWDRSALTLSIVPVIGPISLAPDSEFSDEPLTLLSAPRFLVTELIPKLNNRLTCSGGTVGDPRIVAGRVLRIEGVGEQFGGLYRVTSATHTLDSGGLQTRFEARKEIWFNSIPLTEQGAVPVGVETSFAG